MKTFVVGLLFVTCGITLRAELPAPAFDATSAGDVSAFATADQLWSHVQNQEQSLQAILQNPDPTAKDLVNEMRSSVDAFIRRYPSDTRVWEAKMLQVQLALIALQMNLPQAATSDQIGQQVESITQDAAAPKEVRAQAGLMAVSLAFNQAQANGVPAAWDHVDAEINAFEKAFGDTFSFDRSTPAIVMMREQEVMLMKHSGDEARFKALLQKLASSTQPDIAAMAQQEQETAEKMADLKSKPLDLKYTAVDGTKIDLAQMRGKVVLIDFWATWCVPCVEEVPAVVAAYKKYHAQGFEIVGVSLDTDQAAMASFVKTNGMVWPQYFDGQRWDNAISKGYGIDAIPTMWLVDKNGVLASTDATQNLDAQVEKLLK